MLSKTTKKKQRKMRVRAKIQGTISKPRLCVFRSSKHIYAQLINDDDGKILISSHGLEVSKGVKEKKGKDNAFTAKKIGVAYEVGKLIAKKSLEKKIEQVVFDRSGYKYHGRVKAIAEGAREGGLKF